MPTPTQIIALISTWGYMMILPIAIVEGPIISVISGFLVSLGHLHWFVTYLVLMLGDMMGDTLYYYLGRWGHRPLVRRMVAKVGITPERMSKLEIGFQKHNLKILLFNKTQAAGAIVLYFAGAIRMPFWRFLWINILGSMPKIALLEIIGFYFGKSYTRITTYLDYFGLLTFLIPLGLLGIYWYIRYRTSDKNHNVAS